MSEHLATIQTIAKELLARQGAAGSLLAFCAATHPKWEQNAHHEKMALYLEALEKRAECPYCGRVIESLAVFAPRRHGKTEMVSRRFPAWYLGRHPEDNVICAQATGALAFDTGANVRTIARSPEFRRIFDDFSLQEDAQAAGRWITHKNGVYFGVGVGGTSVGRGANILDIDDPHGGREDADSSRMREIARNWYFGDVLPTLMPPVRQLLTLTRWHQDDLAGCVLPPEQDWGITPDPQFFCCGGWHVLRMRAIEHEGTDHETALWPGRFSLEFLHDLRDKMYAANLGREWKAQYQQMPVAEEGVHLQRQWFAQRYTDLPADCVFYIITDFAVTERSAGRDPDRTEIGVVALAPDDRVYAVHWESLVATSDVWVDRLVSLVDQYEPWAVFGEKGVIKNAIEPALIRAMRDREVFARLEWMPTTTDKLSRGRVFIGWAAQGRVVLPENVPWAENMVDELVAVGGGGRYWDKFDAWAHFFLAIDKNHPAIIRSPAAPARKPDNWQVIDGGLANEWKTA